MLMGKEFDIRLIQEVVADMMNDDNWNLIKSKYFGTTSWYVYFWPEDKR